MARSDPTRAGPYCTPIVGPGWTPIDTFAINHRPMTQEEWLATYSPHDRATDGEAGEADKDSGTA